MSAAVVPSGVVHDFGSLRALHGIDLAVGTGEYVRLLGPSGCGKTTLLSILGGVLDPTEARVEIGGRDVTRRAPARRPTARMFQDEALVPLVTLRDNVAFGPRLGGMGRRARHARAHDMLALAGLEAPRAPVARGRVRPDPRRASDAGRSAGVRHGRRPRRGPGGRRHLRRGGLSDEAPARPAGACRPWRACPEPGVERRRSSARDRLVSTDRA